MGEMVGDQTANQTVKPSAKCVSSVSAGSLIHGAHAICLCVPVIIPDLSKSVLKCESVVLASAGGQVEAQKDEAIFSK
jgi:hypothetical protein